MAMITRVKRTYNLSSTTVEKVKSLASHRLSISQDALVEMAVDDLARRLIEEDEAKLWAEAASDPEFVRETSELLAAYSRADRETWPA